MPLKAPNKIIPKKMDNTIHKNGLIKKGLELLKIFVKEPWKAFTVAEINRISKTKSHAAFDK